MRVVIGLGANLGDRIETLREAASRVASLTGLAVVARSRVYETAPVGVKDQPAFLNAAMFVDYTFSPEALLDELLAIERALGRDRSTDAVRWGPRVIDLDVLWIDGMTVDLPRLIVPHPRLHERAFALIPLLEVAPGAPYVVGAAANDVRIWGTLG